MLLFIKNEEEEDLFGPEEFDENAPRPLHPDDEDFDRFNQEEAED